MAGSKATKATITDLGRSSIPRTRVRPRTTEGVPGIAFYGGWIQDNEKNQDLKGQARYTTFSNMIGNTSIVAAGVRFYLNLIAKAGWSVIPAETEDARQESEAIRMADLVEEIMHDMRRPWHRVVRRAAMYRFYGFSIQEWTAKRRDDGTIGYLDIAPRPQATITQWDLERDGNVLGMIQTPPNGGQDIYLDRGKVIYMLEDSISDSPEGLGLLRHMVNANTRLNLFELLESYSFEGDLRGTPILKGPFAALEDEVRAGTLTPEDRDAMIQPLNDMLLNHNKSPSRGMTMDSEPYRDEGENGIPGSTPQWSFEIIQGGDQGQEQVALAIERLNREMARVMGVEGLLLGGEKVGSMALSVDKSQNFGLIVDSSLSEIREQLQSDFLGPLWLLNGWPTELMPTLKSEQVQYRDVGQITQALTDMAQAGATLPPDWEGINVVVDLLGLPAIDLEKAALDASLDADLDRKVKENSMKPPPGSEGNDPPSNGPEE